MEIVNIEKVTFFFTAFGGKAFYPLLGVRPIPRPLGVVVYFFYSGSSSFAHPGRGSTIAIKIPSFLITIC